MKRKVLGVLFTAMCLCAVPSAAYAEAQEAENYRGSRRGC